jgi:hypothetical protein
MATEMKQSLEEAEIRKRIDERPVAILFETSFGNGFN